MKKSIKVNTAYLAPWMRDYYFRILAERYEPVECKDPDYVLVGVSQPCYVKKDDYLSSGFLEDFPKAKVRIFLQHEAVGFDFTLFDYGVLYTEKLTLDDRFFFADFFTCGYYSQMGHDIYDRLFAPRPDEAAASKTKFCCFQYSHATGVPERGRIFDCLSAYKRVDSLGKYKNNTTLPEGPHYHPRWFEESVEVKRPYKFTIAFENSFHPNGYAITEKIVAAMLANTIPIYWGNPRVGEYFNSRAMVNCHDYSSFEQVRNVVQRIDQDDLLWRQMMGEPWLSREQYDRLTGNLSGLKQFLFKIFDQPVEAAVRRPRGLWVGRYEQEKRETVQNSRLCTSGMRLFEQALRRIGPLTPGK